MLFTEPAVDTVGRRIVGPGHHDVWRSRVRRIPEFAGELPAAAMREEIETPGDGQIRAMVTDRRQPGALHAGRPRPGASPRRARLHGRGRHLPQRDHPARRRDPAADHRARARPVRPGLPRLRGRATPRGSRLRCSPSPTTPGTTGRSSARLPSGCRPGWAPGSRTGWPPRPGSRRARPPSSPGCSRPAVGRRCARCARPRGRRPRAAAADDARAAADRGPADRPRAGAAGRRPRPGRARPSTAPRLGARTSCC